MGLTYILYLLITIIFHDKQSILSQIILFWRVNNLLIISMSYNRVHFTKSAQKYSFSPKASEIRCETPKSCLYTASSPKLMGLPNIGNTCFLNSIIQFLYAAEKFREDLIAKYGVFKEASNGKFGKLLGMIFKSIKENDKSSAALRDQRKILNSMVSKLEEINNEYQRHFQEDAIQTLLNVFNEIQNKHPQLTKLFDIEYSSKCRCCQFCVEERMISYSEVRCVKCQAINQIRVITAPKYIIYSNPLKKTPTTPKIQLGEVVGKGPYTYLQKARIIYIGNGKSGHYMVQREQDKKWFQFSDDSVQNVQGKRNHRGNNSNGLILLYELQQVKKDIVQSRITRSNIHVSNFNDRQKALQGSYPIKIEEQTAEMIEQLDKPIQKIPLNWMTKVKIVRKYLSHFPSTTLAQHKFVMQNRHSSVSLRTIRRDNQTLKEYSDFSQDYNKMKSSHYQENYVKILAEYLLPRLVEMKSSFRIFSIHLQKNPVTEAEKEWLRHTFNSNQDEMFTLNILVTI